MDNQKYCITINNDFVIMDVSEDEINRFKKWIDGFMTSYRFEFGNMDSEEKSVIKNKVKYFSIKKMSAIKRPDLDDLALQDKVENTEFIKEFSEASKDEEFTELPGEIVGDPNESKESFIARFQNVVKCIENEKK
jgi:hypothetical protein